MSKEKINKNQSDFSDLMRVREKRNGESAKRGMGRELKGRIERIGEGERVEENGRHRESERGKEGEFMERAGDGESERGLKRVKRIESFIVCVVCTSLIK